MMWRVGILYRVVELTHLIQEKAIHKADIVRSFASSRFHNVSIENIVGVALNGGWVRITEGGMLECTKKGSDLLSAPTAKLRLRLQIETIIVNETPPWAAVVTQGRKALASYAPPEAIQCFREAGLLDGESDDIVSWWDSLACRYRSLQNQIHVETGRKGEKLTYDYEMARTGKPPQWIALEYADAGYDIISCHSANDPSRLVIEVKTSTLSWDRAEFFVSRSEWDTLKKETYAQLHLWSINTTTPRYSVLSINELKPHVPQDGIKGMWHKFRCPFDCFRSNFMSHE